MMNIVYFEGVLSKVRQVNFKFLAVAVLAIATLTFTGCPGGSTPGNSGGTVSPGDTAATVNGKAIKMEEVEKAIKAQAQGQESRLSPLELATARLQVLQTLVQQEVMYQKAEAEKTIPTDDEVNQAFNKMKTDSRRSAEDIQKEMEAAGQTEATVKEGIKKELAINKLIEKITSKVDAPKDSEIEAFYKGNPDYFVKRKGVRLAAIVIDPNDNGEGDTTKTPADAALKLKEIADQLNQGADFAAVAREKSEDQQSRANGGDLGYITEDQLKQNYPQLAAFMDPKVQIGRVVGPINLEGRYYIFKLQERSDKEETLTLESPGVRQQITDSLINARKQLLSSSYTAIAMEEAKIDNLLAKQVVNNPNELSGARPAPPANANTAATTNTNSNATVGNTNTATNTNANTVATKPAASPAAKANTNTK